MEKGHFDTYTAGGNRFYFCLQNGFENVPERATENCPLDTYGLSMIAVLVDTQGKPVHITTRWNHDHDGEDNPNFHTAQQFQEITHINFYKTFKPYTDEELSNMGIITFDKVQPLLDAGTPIERIFTNIEDMDMQSLNEKLNIKIRNIIQESLQGQKEQIANTNGIINLYQSTTMEKLERMKKSPMFSAEYFGAGGGNMHTRAVYANLDIRQTAKLNYGNVIVHLEFHSTWDKILCINRFVSRKYCGGKDIIDQLKNFPRLYSLVLENQYLVNNLKRSYESGNNESMAIVELCKYLASIKEKQMMDNNDDMRNIAHKSSGAESQDFSHAILTEFGIEGFVYYGSFDGMCCIPLNADKVIPIEYAISQRRPADLNTIEWQSFNTQFDAGQVNHIQAFMSKFGNQYIWDRNERSYLNTILVRKRLDNLFYYLDTLSGESIFPIGFYNARPFDPTFKRAWVQIYADSHPMFIDKKGKLYRTIRGRQVSDLYLWMRHDDDNFDNDDENNIDGFSFLPGELD